MEALLDPNIVLNADDIIFSLYPEKSRVMPGKVIKDVYEIDQSYLKCFITLIFEFLSSVCQWNLLSSTRLEIISVQAIQCVPPKWGIGKSNDG